MEVFSAISGALAKQLLRHYGKLNEVPDDVDPAIDHHVAAKKVAVWALVLGLFMEFLVGPLLDMAAYGFAPASLIAPLASVQLLVNIIVAPHTLNEERLPGHIISAVVIGVAIVGITIFGHHPEPEFSLELLEALFRRWIVFFYFVFFFSWQFCHGFLVVARRPQGDLIRGLSLGMMGGAFNGNMYCIKSLVELIKVTFNAESIGDVWAVNIFPYIIVAGTAVFVAMNAFMVTKAHKEYDACS